MAKQTLDLVVLRPWNRRKDRSAIERWPVSQLPEHWKQAEPIEGRRESWAIEIFEPIVLVGRISLRDFSGNSAMIGIYLHPHYYDRGIGSQALEAFFTISPVRTLLLEVATDNSRALRCYEKCGFRRVSLSYRGGFEYVEMERTCTR